MNGRTMIPLLGIRLALLGLLWLILTGGSLDGVLLGLVTVPAACWLSLRLLPPAQIRPLRVLALVPWFLWRSLIGGIDVARRAFDPRLPIDPSWVRVPVALPPGGRVALGAELSLMPGTLVAGSDGTALLVHMLDRGQEVEQAVQAEAARIATLIETDR